MNSANRSVEDRFHLGGASGSYGLKGFAERGAEPREKCYKVRRGYGEVVGWMCLFFFYICCSYICTHICILYQYSVDVKVTVFFWYVFFYGLIHDGGYKTM